MRNYRCTTRYVERPGSGACLPLPFQILSVATHACIHRQASRPVVVWRTRPSAQAQKKKRPGSPGRRQQQGSAIEERKTRDDGTTPMRHASCAASVRVRRGSGLAPYPRPAFVALDDEGRQGVQETSPPRREAAVWPDLDLRAARRASRRRSSFSLSLSSMPRSTGW
jgi:hypothetical protein